MEHAPRLVERDLPLQHLCARKEHFAASLRQSVNALSKEPSLQQLTAHAAVRAYAASNRRLLAVPRGFNPPVCSSLRCC